jgi:peptidoglycan/xylan/chitin deacetylase (PgdA/CDA1 family)
MNIFGDLWLAAGDWWTTRRLRFCVSQRYWSIVCLHESPPDTLLRATLERAAEHYQFVSLEQGLQHLQRGDFKRPLLTITYDDADRSVYDYALAVHADLKIPACVYVCTGYIREGLRHLTHGSPRPTMTWQELSEWTAAGLDVGGHTVNHIPLAQATSGRARWEITASMQAIEDKLGIPVRHFAYPWGIYTDELADWVDKESPLESMATTVSADNYPPQRGKHLYRRSLMPSAICGINWARRFPEDSFVQTFRRHFYRRILRSQAPVVFREFHAADTGKSCVSEQREDI